MNVSYKGVAGELVKLERYEKHTEFVYVTTSTSDSCAPDCKKYLYNLEIWDKEKCCVVIFSGVVLKDVKFLDGVVTYGR